MKIWLIIVLFLTAIFLDGIIFPVFFGFRESFLTIIFIVAILLYHEAGLKGLFLGTLLSGLTEFYWGLKPGILMLSLLMSAGAFILLNKFFNVRSKVLMVFSGVIMFVVFWGTSILVNKIL